MVVWLAEKFLAEGKRVAILSRGYRGRHGSSDEIALLKLRLGGSVRFGVGPDRFQEGRKLEEAEPVDVFLLDDGFQHLKLARDVDIVMLDGSKKLQDDWLLPAGSLREPAGAWRRSDLLVVTRRFESIPIEANDSRGLKLFYAQTRLLGFRRLGELGAPFFMSRGSTGPFFGFCGIGNPRAFFDDLRRWRLTLADTREFRDHHRYSQADAALLELLAQKAGATALLTTEKDEQNLREVKIAGLPAYVAVIDLVLTQEAEFNQTLGRVLAERRGNRP